VRAAAGIAPASQLGRAVGQILVAAATAGTAEAERGAALGCEPGVGRMVEIALARLILHALPSPRRETADPPPPPRPAPASPSVGEPLLQAQPALPPPAWWSRERASEAACGWTQGWGGPAHEAARLWPQVPAARADQAGRRGVRRLRVAAGERGVLGLAWRTLEEELQPTRVRHGGAR
jgi:hypothetical protein